MEQFIATPTGKIIKKEKTFSLLGKQIFLCIIILLLIFCFSKISPDFRKDISLYIHDAVTQGISVASPDEIARFASKVADNVKKDAKDFLKKIADPLTGKGGTCNGTATDCFDPRAPYYISARFYCPLLSSHVTSAYGCRVHPITNQNDFHTGIDLAAEKGTPVSAALSGVVTEKGADTIRGNYVEILHDGGIETRYFHLQYAQVRKGQKIKRGDVIGRVGETGYATGPHLHFEIKINGKRVNPDIALMQADRI